jgi:hypothetical protein
MTNLLTCDEFRALSAYYKYLRREIALPTLKQRKSTLSRELGLLYRQRDDAATSKHDAQRIDTDMKPLQWDYQYVSGQIAVIESERDALLAAGAVLKEAS